MLNSLWRPSGPGIVLLGGRCELVERDFMPRVLDQAAICRIDEIERAISQVFAF
jgi:hypothetical protein